MTLPAIYKKNNAILFSFINPIPSNVKAEKVVKPPQIPVIRKSFQFSFTAKDLKVSPQKKPISKQPTILTANVPQGK